MEMTDEQVKDATAKIKELADTRTQSMDDVDRILRIYHTAVTSGQMKVGEQEVLQELLDKVGYIAFREVLSVLMAEGDSDARSQHMPQDK